MVIKKYVNVWLNGLIVSSYFFISLILMTEDKFLLGTAVLTVAIFYIYFDIIGEGRILHENQ